MKGGFTEEESMEVVKTLAAAGIDLIEISGGTYENPSMMGSLKNVKESTRQREAYFLTYAEQVRKLVDTPLVVTGGFRSSAGMQDALDSGATDMIGIARPLALCARSAAPGNQGRRLQLHTEKTVYRYQGGR